jgi:fatty acid desaturase
MNDDTLVQFTAHELAREDLHGLMARSDGPALLRAALHFGVLVVTGTVSWKLRFTPWILPLMVVHGYVLAFLFCAFHETAHRTAFRSRWLNVMVGTLAGLLTLWPYRRLRDILRLARGRADRPWMAPPERRP